MTIDEAVQEAKKSLAAAGVPDYPSDALLLLQSVCGISRAKYYACGDEEMPGAKRYLETVRMRARRIPLQQITGEQYFCGLRFRVTEDVLCPRQETELLVEEAGKLLGKGDLFLDLCTGSGCIAVSLLTMEPELNGIAADLSEKALAVARENAVLHHVEDRLVFRCADLFDGCGETVDLIVSNPPYIATAAIDSLMEEVRDHEPRMALDGGADGLDFYRRILQGAGAHLKDGGYLIVEIGYDQGDAVRSMFDDCGYESVRVIRDLAGLNRIVLGRRGA